MACRFLVIAMLNETYFYLKTSICRLICLRILRVITGQNDSCSGHMVEGDYL